MVYGTLGMLKCVYLSNKLEREGVVNRVRQMFKSTHRDGVVFTDDGAHSDCGIKQLIEGERESH